MPKAPTLTDEILAAAATIRRGPGNWFDRLPLDVQEELRAIRRNVRDGSNASTKTGVAKGIQIVLQKRGLTTVKWQEMSKWLDADG